MVTMLSACTKNKTPVQTYEDGMKDACFKMGGLLNQKDECVLPEPTPVIQTVEVEKIVTIEVPVERTVEEVDNSTPSSELSENTVVYFGKTIGSFHLTPNEIYSRWELNWDERYRIRTDEDEGRSCQEVALKGATGSFIMPKDGYVNSVVGDIIVNNVKWRNGNPITGPNGEQLVPKGATVNFVFYGTASDCLAIWIPYN